MQNKSNATSTQISHPLVSFIVTYYNLPVQMLCECIDSILALSLSADEREIIIVDDGSEVSPINALMQYGDKIIYLRQSNAGVSVARNKGLQIARGTYIQFVDGDDSLLKTAYDFCLDMIRQQQDADIIVYDFTHSQKYKIKNYRQPVMTSGVAYLHGQNTRGAVWCLLFKQAIRGSLEFTPGIIYGEDEEFTAQLLLRAETIYITEACAYFYRIHNLSAIHQTSEERKAKRLNDTQTVIFHLHDLCDKLPPTDQSAMQRRVAQLTMDYIYNIIILTQSATILEERLKDLHRHGLFPLPDRDYSKKYVWFRRMTNTALGRTILLNTLPLLKRER